MTVYMYGHVCARVCISEHVCVCVCVYMDVCVCICHHMCGCVCVCMCVCVTSGVEMKEMARPLVPKRPARPTLCKYWSLCCT